jgi:DNA-binding NtrC family response regulator
VDSTRTIVVDPDPERREQLARVLQDSGFQVSLAGDLAAALLDAVRNGDPAGNGSGPPPRPTLAEVERRYAREILRQTGGNKTRAAEILGIDRKTLYRLIDDPARRKAAAAAPIDA